jgi:[protein-PII] uridylyltransferase
MTILYDNVPQRRMLIDRRQVAGEIATVVAGHRPEERRSAVAAVLKRRLDSGRAEMKRRIAATPGRGIELAAAQSFLIEQLLRLAADAAVTHLYPRDNPTLAEQIALIAVGGFGRAEMAPYSDVDIMFLAPMRATAWVEQIVESILYILWDLGLKVGHATRTPDDMIRIARDDITVRTALLESRFLWGARDLADAARLRFRREIVSGHAREFILAKLAERDERHRRMGDSRYMVEPNIKEGKGGLRDLQTLFWLGKFAFEAEASAELVEKGLFTLHEYHQFTRALNHHWAVRINLHDLAGRAEERLTFDVQRELAARMHYVARPGMSAVERFMRHHFLTAKLVGDLTAVFAAHMEERFARMHWRTRVLRTPARRISGFRLAGGRLEVADDDFFRTDRVRLIEMFAIADREGASIHPNAMRQAARDVALINESVRRDPRANALFLEILASPRDPERVLRLMNDAGVFGRFLPDFGRVVAKMQYDMYHHYTVDEHTIRAIGLLSAIEHRTRAAELPWPTEVFGHIASRRAVYVAVLLHDIAKGRGGDHSVLGEEIAHRLGPRLGLTAGETETVAWLVRHHLLMSATAFKRDLSDFKTILDFSEQVQSIERLRLLYVLTVVDISAVGPNVWNGWKAELLRTLYDSAEEVLRRGHKHTGRGERIEQRQQMVRALVGGDAALDAFTRRLPDSYWISETPEVVAANFRMVREADAAGAHFMVRSRPEAAPGTTLVSIYATDHPGLFYRVAGGISLGGANIVGARIYTTRDGMALDNLVVQDPLGGPFDDRARLERMEQAIGQALRGEVRLAERLRARPLPRWRQDSFSLVPQVFIDNRASNRFTVIEVNALDRPALLYALTFALYGAKVTIHSAHIATYGERAVDTFYITDLTGDKIDAAPRLRTLEKRLLEAAEAPARGIPAIAP